MHFFSYKTSYVIQWKWLNVLFHGGWTASVGGEYTQHEDKKDVKKWFFPETAPLVVDSPPTHCLIFCFAWGYEKDCWEKTPLILQYITLLVMVGFFFSFSKIATRIKLSLSKKKTFETRRNVQCFLQIGPKLSFLHTRIHKIISSLQKYCMCIKNATNCNLAAEITVTF